MSGRRIEVLVAVIVAGAAFAVASPAGAQAASSHPAMAKKAAPAMQGTVKVKEETTGLAAQATISADSAQKIALGQVSRGWVREAELEQQKNGTLVYSYDIKSRGKAGVEEVLVDAKTGAVVSKTHETAAAEAKEAAGEKAATKSSAKSSAAKSSAKTSSAKKSSSTGSSAKMKTTATPPATTKP
jgi:uncharacterized membrane protein YkoI